MDWKDHVVDTNTGAVIQQGTPVSAKNLNNIEQGVAALFDQLEASKVQQAKLLPGGNVINLDQASDVDLTLFGSAPVNLLKDGNFEDTSKWSVASCSITLDNTSFVYGNSSLKATATGINSSGLVRSKTLVPIDNTKYFIAITEMKNTSATSTYLRVMKPDFSATLKASTPKTGTESYLLHYVKLSPTDLIGLNSIAFDLVFPYVNSGSVINIDGGDVYEVDKSLYDRIGVDITESNIRDYLPHVDGKQHVNGVLITKQGRNLYDGGINASSGGLVYTEDRSTSTLTVTSGVGLYHYAISKRYAVAPNTTYTLSYISTSVSGIDTARVSVRKGSDNGASLIVVSDGIGAKSVTFNTGTETEIILFWYGSMGTATVQTKRYDNIQLKIGSTRTTYETAEPQRLILPVALGEVAGVKDQLTVRGNEALLTQRIRKGVSIDSSLVWSVFVNAASGAKLLTVKVNDSTKGNDCVRLTRYDGFSYAMKLDGINPGNAYMTSSPLFNSLAFSLSNAESGWIDALTPSTNAIKAFANGWKANANDGSKYTSWVSILTGSTPATNTEAFVAANKAPGWTAYATADYVLATPEIKPINVEGAISLHPGGNQIAIETGIILREKVSIFLSSSTGKYHINAGNSTLNNRTDNILAVYKWDVEDVVWKKKWRSDGDSNNDTRGPLSVEADPNDVDPNAEYYVSYIAMDKYKLTANVIDASCIYGANTKTILDRTVSNVAELGTKTSVLTRSVAELYKKVKALGG